MNDFGIRLKEERKRLGLNQDEMAALAGLKRMAQLNYEKGERAPDSDYLTAIAEAGADVQYLLTGRRQVAVADDEDALLAAYRVASPALRDAAVTVLSAGVPKVASQPNVQFTGTKIGQVLKGREIRQDGLTINVGGRGNRGKAPK